MNVELLRAKMKEKELLEEQMQIECKKSIGERIKATLTGARSRCSFLNTEYLIGLYGLLVPYLLGFIVITILCLSLVDISLDSYFEILAESFSITGLWVIGYFLLSILLSIYFTMTYLFNRV